MSRVTECCWYIPLREGCLLASLFEFVLATLETSEYIFFSRGAHADEKALQIVGICNITMCAIWLFFGALKEERICVILHNFFIVMMLMAQLVFEIFAFKFAFFIRSPDWLIAYHIIYHCFLVYMIFVCFSYAVELRDKNFSDTGGFGNRHRTHRLMSSAMSSELYGL